MKMKLLIAAAVMVSSPVLAQDQACLRVGQIYNWKVLDNQTMVVEDLSHNKFKLGLMGYCTNLAFKERVGFKSIGGTQLSCLSAGDDVVIRDQVAGGPCPIKTIVPYTAEMEKADKDTAAAKKSQ
jgi:hypothetical protein